VAGLSLQTDALVLLKQPPADNFQGFTVFSVEQGVLPVLQRLSRKNPSAGALDLFDEAGLLLESSNQGRTWFLREARLLVRHEGMGRNYDAVRFASALALLAARNPVLEESRPAVAALLRSAFAALASGPRPEVVFFKSLYRFARDEGYPVKQDWLARLPSRQRAAAGDALNRPIAEQTATPDAVADFTRQLETYLRAQTEILLD